MRNAISKTFALSSLSAALLAAGVPMSAVAAADPTLDTVVVTGVRGSQPRTVTNSPAPIDVISAEQLEKIGQSGLKDILTRLLPSFNAPTINGGGTAFLVRGISMRGLGGDQVLILVNGKRRHNTAMINNNARVGVGAAPVDLDLIPTAAIERIEVLRDGAAAQYGSDAIAGVINIILKKDDSGITSDSSLGQYYSGDGTTGHEAANFGSPLGDGGFFNLSFDAKVQEPYDRAGAVQGTYPNLSNGQPDPRNTDRHGWGEEYGLGRDRTTSVAYNLELPLQNDVTLYSFSTLSYRDGKKVLGHRPPTDVTALNNRTDGPYPRGGQATREVKETDYQFAFGGKGEVAEWKWDLSTTYGRDRAKLYSDNNVNLSNGPANFGEHRFYLADETFDQWTNNLDFTRALDIGWSSPLETSFGVEYRWERYELGEGEPNSYNNGGWVNTGGVSGGAIDPGLFSVNGTSPDDAATRLRHSGAAYVDFGLNITSKWYAAFALRQEQYNQDIGETTSGKLTTRYEFLPGYAVRAAVSNGFRAPSLAMNAFSATSSVTQFVSPGVTTTNRTKQLRPDSPEAIALGATDLKPEKSRNYSLGLTAEPVERLRLTADLYLIDIDDRILQTGQLTGTAVSNILVANGLAPGLTAQYFTNAADTRTKGIDVVADYSQDLGEYGSAKWSVAYNYNKTTIRDLADTPPELSSLGAGYVLFDRQMQTDLTKATPKDKWILATNYRLDNWNVNLAFTRYGEYTEGSNNPLNDRTYSPKWITDLDIAYDISDNVTVAVGANNLFNQYPDSIGIVPWAGTYEYGMFSPFGLGGGYYYGRLSLAF